MLNLIYFINLIGGISSLLAVSILTPIQSILWLIILFVCTSLSLYNQGFILLGILYLLIYVGAIAILFLFILSLLNIEFNPKGSFSPLVISILLISLIPLDLSYETYGIVTNVYSIWNELTVAGNQLYTEYAFLLGIAGLILMLSVIGAISIVK